MIDANDTEVTETTTQYVTTEPNTATGGGGGGGGGGPAPTDTVAVPAATTISAEISSVESILISSSKIATSESTITLTATDESTYEAIDSSAESIAISSDTVSMGTTQPPVTINVKEAEEFKKASRPQGKLKCGIRG